MRERDGPLVFFEVGARRSAAFVGAAASIGAAKQRGLALAARVFPERSANDAALAASESSPFDADRIEWLRASYGLQLRN